MTRVNHNEKNPRCSKGFRSSIGRNRMTGSRSDQSFAIDGPDGRNGLDGQMRGTPGDLAAKPVFRGVRLVRPVRQDLVASVLSGCCICRKVSVPARNIAGPVRLRSDGYCCGNSMVSSNPGPNRRRDRPTDLR